MGGFAIGHPYAPTSSALRRIALLLASRGMTLTHVLRDYDRAAWPDAASGFFRFRKVVTA